MIKLGDIREFEWDGAGLVSGDNELLKGETRGAYSRWEEIERLRHENNKQALQITTLQQDRGRLRKRVAELEEDAERWRKHWPAIRDAYKYMANESDNAELHAAIDAAMGAGDD